MRTAAVLKHKNTDIALFDINSAGLLAVHYLDENTYKHSPFLKKMDLEECQTWWNLRAIPNSRPDLKEILRNANCDSAQQYLLKNLALSLSDCYWVCPLNVELSWEQVNPYINETDLTFLVEGNNKFTNNPHASLGGEMKKKSYKEDGVWYLKKESPHSTQCINEGLASWINELQGFPNYTPYTLNHDEDGFASSCTCKFFTDENTEYITMLALSFLTKKRNDVSPYEHIVQACTSLGLNESEVRRQLDYQTMLDFIISNTDRHYQNFGILRNPDTLEVISMAPIFDNGNSMFFDEYKGKIPQYSAKKILEIPINGIVKYEEKMLSYITDKFALDVAKLPSKEEVKDFYLKNKGLLEEYATNLAENYQKKVTMLSQFQKGISVTARSVTNWNDFINKEPQKQKTAEEPNNGILLD